MPRLPPKWPPIEETTSMMRSRISCASCGSCWRSSLRRSDGELMLSSSRVMAFLRSALANVTPDRCQIVHRAADDSSVFTRLGQQLIDARARRRRADQSGISELPLCSIFARRFPELLRRLLLIEQIIDDLKGQADRPAKTAERIELRIGGVSEETAEDDAGSEKLAGLVAVNEFECLKCGDRL